VRALLEIIHYWAPTVAAVATTIVGISALYVYRRNSRLERARWASELYKDFYAQDRLKTIRDRLDCSANSEDVNQLVIEQNSEFTDYLNFFEYIVFLKNSGQLQTYEVEHLFGYYLDCLKRHVAVQSTFLIQPMVTKDLLSSSGSENDRLPLHIRDAHAE
jgi:hypothetical protein